MRKVPSISGYGFKSYPRVSQILLSCTSTGVRSHISHPQNVTCFRHEMAENCLYGIKQQPPTHSLLVVDLRPMLYLRFSLIIFW